MWLRQFTRLMLNLEKVSWRLPCVRLLPLKIYLNCRSPVDTFLNVIGEQFVLEKVKRCWASLWTARAIGYRTRNNISHCQVSLAVIVQKLVPADAAGIMFTANPLTGARDQLVINASWGLGEAIVGSKVTPDTIIVDKLRKKIIEKRINQKDIMTVCDPGGTHEEPVPPYLRQESVLKPAQVSKLVRIGIKVENLYGMPMDIEWALERGQILFDPGASNY